MTKTRRWKSSKPSNRQTIRHAPNPDVEGFAYCSQGMYCPDELAKRGERIDCKSCLRRLRNKPQYANYLHVQKGIVTMVAA